VSGKLGLAFDNCNFVSKGNITADEIVKQNAEWPDGLWEAKVATTGDPFGRCIAERAFEISVDSFAEYRARAKVDQVDLASAGVDKKVFIFDISMQHLEDIRLRWEDKNVDALSTYATLVHIFENLNDLFEEVTRQTFVESIRALADKIVEITTMFGSLEDDHKLVVMDEIIKHVDNIFNFGDTL
jgi:hypothetical protein